MQSLAKKNKILVLCHDTIGAKMAGPGIRYHNIAEHLKKVADVSLGVFSDSEKLPMPAGITRIFKNDDSYKKIFDKYDIIFAQWLSGTMLDYANSQGKTIIFDLYAPVPIEYLASLEFSKQKITHEKDVEFSGILETYSKYLQQGDYFVCSNERQRDFWIGYITANGFIKPTNFGGVNLFKKFAICPMGISKLPPTKTKLKLRSSLNIEADDFVLLWTGGIWDWFDAQLIIKAVAKLKNPKVKLVFLGTKHPNNIYKEEMSESVAARSLAKKLDLVDKSVYFLDGWVPYDERAAYFLDANAAIYADKESLETRFSHRTRVLDHIWTNLPTICSQGDYMAELIERNDFGVVVPHRDPSEFAEAIDKLSKDKEFNTKIKSNIESRKHLFTWESTLEPLVEFVRHAEPKSNPRATKTAELHNSSKLRMRSRVKKAVKILIKGNNG